MSVRDFLTSTGGGAFAGSILGLGGGVLQNQASAKQAQKQMDFQERMSNTAYQRAADDLEAAGLNRILALGSPASTPGGAMAPMSNLGSSMVEGANMGINLASGAQDVKTKQASADKMIKESKILDERLKREILQSEFWEKFRPVITMVGESIKGWEMLFAELTPEGLERFKYFLNSPSKMIRDAIGAWMKEKWKGIEKSKEGQWVLDALGQSIEVTKETFNEAKKLWK